jgi:hypothetical protein
MEINEIRNENTTDLRSFPSTGVQGEARGTLFPLKRIGGRVGRMNFRLSDDRIRSTCRELLREGTAVSGRALRRALRDRYGSVGQTARVFQIWREEVGAPLSPVASRAPLEESEFERRLDAAEGAAAESRARAERAEYRELAHQDHWGMEIDRLREQLRAAPKYAAEIRHLQDQVFRLTAELKAARALSAAEMNPPRTRPAG